MDRRNIEKITQNADERILLAKLWDKITPGIQRCIPVNTGFLSPYELELAHFLFGEQEGLISFGGYSDAERKILCFLPDYMDKTFLFGEDSPITCLHAEFYQNDSPTHRDFLGALMGIGITRETVGDICVDNGSCDFFAMSSIVPYLLQNFTTAGRTKLRLETIPITNAHIPVPNIKVISDTMASVRLDSIISSGFRIGRTLATQCVNSGKVSVNGMVCVKPDKLIAEGSKISARGFGKIKLQCIRGETKKGRISVIIHRYM